MTIICYRDGMMASDSWIMMADSYSVFANTKKIIKTKKGTLAGATGKLSSLSEFLKWVAKDKLTNPPEYIFDEEFTGLMILPNKKILLWESVHPSEVTAEYFVIGSGYDIALGALANGCNAAQAVATTIKHCKICGGDIQVEML